MSGYLPWWLGASGLAIASVGYFWWTRRTMGASGSLARVVDWRVARKFDEEAAAMNADLAAVEAALLDETAAEFGDAAAPSGGGAPAKPEAAAVRLTRLPWSAHVSFVLAIFGGALVTSYVRSGGLQVRNTLGPDFEQLVAHGWRQWLALAAGGIFVGFGTHLAGGCTTGHGISGCARFQPGSLIATGIFFGCAVAVSMLLGMMVTS